MTDLPDVILIEIFRYLTTKERLFVASCVCRRWQTLVNSAQVWSCVDFSYERKLTCKDLTKFVFPGTKKVLLDECHELEWKDIYSILKKCKSLEVLSLAWIGYINQPALEVSPDLLQLKISDLRYLNLSHCTLTDNLFKEIAIKCQNLSIFILLASKGVSEETFKFSSFKTHKSLKLINVGYVANAIGFSCVLNLLEYGNSKVLLDISGNQISEDELDEIERILPRSTSRIVDINDYCHMLY